MRAGQRFTELVVVHVLPKFVAHPDVLAILCDECSPAHVESPAYAIITLAGKAQDVAVQVHVGVTTSTPRVSKYSKYSLVAPCNHANIPLVVAP